MVKFLMKHAGHSKLSLILLIAMVLFTACGGSRRMAEVDRPAVFYHDPVHHLMVRIDPENGDGVIDSYNRYMQEHPHQAYRFYQDEVLGLQTAYDKMVYSVSDLRATGDQVELVERPVPVYPEKKPIYGRMLIVEISMIVAPDGSVEYAELANIRRSSDEPESITSAAVTGGIPGWVDISIHGLDHPYILNSLQNATGYRFRPLQLHGHPVRFNVIVSYLYDADRMPVLQQDDDN